MLPSPTAEPAEASTTPSWLPKLPLAVLSLFMWECFSENMLQRYTKFSYLCRVLLKKSPYMLLLYFRRYPITFLLAFAIVLLSLLPIPDVRMPVEVPLVDKWTHMVMYGVLTLVIWLEYIRAHRQMRGLRLLSLAFLAPIAMGGALELMQAYLTTCRSGEWLDFVANSIGAVVGAGCGLLASRLGGRSSAKPKTGV